MDSHSRCVFRGGLWEDVQSGGFQSGEEEASDLGASLFTKAPVDAVFSLKYSLISKPKWTLPRGSDTRPLVADLQLLKC